MIGSTTNSISEIDDRLIDCSLVEAVDKTAKGHLRLQTNFRYPDGSSIDLFIKKRNDLLDQVEPILLTDFGNTSAWLSNLQIYPNKSQRRSAFMSDILETYGVRNSSGNLELSVEPGQLAAGLMKLGQSCLRLGHRLIKSHPNSNCSKFD